MEESQDYAGCSLRFWRLDGMGNLMIFDFNSPCSTERLKTRGFDKSDEFHTRGTIKDEILSTGAPDTLHHDTGDGYTLIFRFKRDPLLSDNTRMNAVSETTQPSG